MTNFTISYAFVLNLKKIEVKLKLDTEEYMNLKCPQPSDYSKVIAHSCKYRTCRRVEQCQHQKAHCS